MTKVNGAYMADQHSERAQKNTSSDKGDSSGWSATLYNKAASFVYSPLNTTAILGLLDARRGERILDVGCGSGEVTLFLQGVVEQLPGGLVVGADKSQSMIDKAIQNGVKYAFVADAQALELPSDAAWGHDKFDAVFSNAVFHWCKLSPLGVLRGMRNVLKPGGRLVLEMGGFANCIGVRSALHEVINSRGRNPQEVDPWYFPSLEEYEKLLVSAGFEIKHITLTPRMTPLDAGLISWLETFVRSSFLRDFEDREAHEIMREVEGKCRIDCQDSNGKWWIMYTRLRVSAIMK